MKPQILQLNPILIPAANDELASLYQVHKLYMIEDVSASSPAEAAIQANLRAAIDEALDALTPREAKVLRMRFGLDMVSDHTLEEVGKQFDVTRERIRQIETKAMRKLQHPSRADKLKLFLER